MGNCCCPKVNKTTAKEAPNGKPNYILEFQQLTTIEELLAKLEKPQIGELGHKCYRVLDDVVLPKQSQGQSTQQDLIQTKEFLQCLLELSTKLNYWYSNSTAKLRNSNEEKDSEINALKSRNGGGYSMPNPKGPLEYHQSSNHRHQSENSRLKSEIERLRKAVTDKENQIRHLQKSLINPWSESNKTKHADEMRQVWEKVNKSQQKNGELDQKCMALWSENHQLKKKQESSQQQISELFKQKNQLQEHYNFVHHDALGLKEELDKSGRWIQGGDQPRKEYSKQVNRSQNTNSVYDNTYNSPAQNQQLGNDGYTNQNTDTESYYYGRATKTTTRHPFPSKEIGNNSDRSSHGLTQYNVQGRNEARIEQLQQDIQTLQHDSQQKGKEIKQLENDKNKCYIDIERLKQDNQRIPLESHKALTQKAIYDLQCEQEKCEQIHRREMNNHQKTIRKKDREIVDLQQDLQNRQDEVVSLKEQLQSLANTERGLQSAYKSVSMSEQTISDLTALCSDKDLQINAEREKVVRLKSQVGTLFSEVDKLQITLSQRDNTITKHQQLLTQKEQSIYDLQCEQEKCEQIHRREMNSYQKTINQKNREIANLQQDLQNRPDGVLSLKEQLQRMDDNIRRQEAKIAEQKARIKQLQQEVQNAQHDSHQKAAKIAEQEARTEELQQYLQMAQHKPSKRDRHREVEENQEILQRKEKELQSVKRELGARNGQIQELSRKLAAEMSTKLASDESNVENVSIKNRPMNVAEEYQLLCSNQWLDAKTALDDLCNSSTPDFVKVQLLSDVIMVSETASTSMLQQIIEHFEWMVFDPIKCVFQEGKTGPSSKTSKKPKKGGHLSKELNNMYGDMLRTAADNIDISRLVKDVIHGLKNSNTRSPVWNTAIDTEEVHTYVADTARICWKMVIQRPRMEFKRCDKWLGEKFQDLYWNSDNTPGAVVVQVYPMLYHGTSMMAKGKVLLIEQRKMVTY